MKTQLIRMIWLAIITITQFTFSFSAYALSNTNQSPSIDVWLRQNELHLTPGPKKKCQGSCPWSSARRVFDAGQLDLHAGYGVLPSFARTEKNFLVPPVQMELDYRIKEHISIGFFGSYSNSKIYNNVNMDRLKVGSNKQQFLLAVRPAVHVTFVDNWDFYSGAAIGFRQVITNEVLEYQALELKSSESNTSHNKGKWSADFTPILGLRYIAWERLQIGAELGFGLSRIAVGISYRML